MNGSETPSAPSSEAHGIATIAAEITRNDFPTGVHATLRRMDPHRPAAQAVVSVERLINRTAVEPKNEAERKRWVVIIHCLSLARGQHDITKPTGQVLAEIYYSEQRLARLLTTELSVATDMTVRLARLLGSKRTPTDWVPLGQILLWSNRDEIWAQGWAEERADNARRKIARAYARSTTN